ncbi:MAG TPA: DUF488 family protein [Pseudonocardia sp.]|jgi:uncharacterized protein YeaO (DUF488 family)|nr:DUF488 family protein [Pseudonocardia sp.]
MEQSPSIRVARVYDDLDAGEGARVLVDRLWPRGLSKESAALDEWCRDVAPSTELRTWYRHDPARFDEFAARYRAELTEPDRAEAVAALQSRYADRQLILLTATKDLELSHATVLAGILSGSDQT